MNSTITIQARDNFTLTGTHWRNENPKGIIAINAGTCVDRTFYQQFAEWIAAQHYDVLTYDYRGVGDSRPKSLKGFKASIIDWGKLDIPAVIDWMNDQYPTQKKYMIGHSMGGQVIGLAENINQLDKVIAFVPSYGNWQNNAPKGRWKTGLKWATLFPLLVFRNGYFPASRMNMGNDWPWGVTWDWWSWGIRRIPHAKIMDNKGIQHFYPAVKIPIKAYFTTDDLLATIRCIPHYKSDFSNADLEIVMLNPTDFGLEKIAHMGMFRKKCIVIWQMIIADLELES